MDLEFIVGSKSVKLTNYGMLLPGRAGDLAPETVLETRRVGNTLVKSIYRQERRPMDIPMLFQGDRESESPAPVTLKTKMRAILDVLTAGEGTLRATELVNGLPVVRNLTRCYYRDGLREQNLPGRSLTTVLSFDALDPYWYETVATEVSFTTGGAVGELFFPIFPLRLLVSAVLDQQTVNNPGVECWPIWTITGPGSTVSVENVTSRRKTVWLGTLGATDVLEIDTRPLYKTVRLNGVNAWDDVQSANADLWPLESGDNDILVTMADATVDSEAVLAYTPRYVSL